MARLSARLTYALVAAATLGAGAALWWIARAPPADGPSAPQVAPAALFAATFSEPSGASRSLGEYQGRILVVNFWATWCAPCREEMPGFARLQARWRERGVQFVGLADDDAAKVERFGRELGINYPLWIGSAAGELSRRLGNRLGVLPHTVILGRAGEVRHTKVGTYSEQDLETILEGIFR